MTIRIENPREFAGKAKEKAEIPFVLNKDGETISKDNPQNTLLAIRGRGVGLRYNEFAARTEVTGLLGEGPEFTDNSANLLHLLIHETYGFMPSDNVFNKVTDNVAWKNKFHPVRDFLDGLKWDGVPRIDTWLTVYAGAEDTPFNRAVGRIWLVAGVRRVRQPGCKFDTVVVFETRIEGKNKSSALAELATNPAWFTDNVYLGAPAKEVIELTSGSWIIEFAEMDGVRTRELEKIKSFLSRQVDKARPAYGRRTQTVPRQFIPAGTTNDREYLQKDERRLWPVVVKKFDLDALRRDAEQLWAEAAHYEALRADNAGRRPMGARGGNRRKHILASPVRDLLRVALGDGPGWVSAKSVWNILDVVDTDQKNKLAPTVGKAMAALEFVREEVYDQGNPRGERHENYYERGDDPLSAYLARPAALATYRACTGRSSAPVVLFTEAALCVGRRGGKSRVLALIAVYLETTGRIWRLANARRSSLWRRTGLKRAASSAL